jgi:hypothetical protein
MTFLTGDELTGDDKSLAGKWGDEYRKKLPHIKEKRSKTYYVTENSTQYSVPPMELMKQRAASPMIKFSSLQRSGFSLTSLRRPLTGVTEEELPNMSRGGAFGSEGSALFASRPSTTSTSKPNTSHEVDPPPSRSVFTDSYRNPYSRETDDGTAPRLDVSRTNSKLLRSAAAPIAFGRSTNRPERGVATSGLSGERLNLSNDCHKNSLAQRSWLYSDDPALLIRMAGRPTARPVGELSITMPNEKAAIEAEQRQLRLAAGEDLATEDAEVVRKSISQGRKFVMTGDILSKTGSRRAYTFLDENDHKVL